ncbi:efflux RND transporter periplasmic adaptor subunit [Cetobacterium somerae]|uniref:efflux RND transporter periplasmic adaptor subunit n=1 Tax=Cetobacterium sp. NK01 TaxID=2993530 RepID=UPI002117127B|nr:efflux RND transporter periplasmic adaptor subunit [Cetobacterium sp. NK01]MCQ8212436.1 efflux RND transporter periplasmic adaptor subunit [Cetobacterium sp. NK01]
MKKGLFILTAAAILMTACGKKEEAVVEKPKKPVIASQVKQEQVADVYTTDGAIVPKEKVNHTLDTQGTVSTVLKKNGDSVKKGEVIVKFTDAKVESNFEAAKANLQSTKNNFEKFNKLYEKQMVSQLEFLNYRDAYTNALADYTAKKSNYDKLTRKSELTGVVGNLNLKSGNVVDANTPVFTVVDESLMEISVDFPGYWLNSLNEGSPVIVTVSDLGGKEFEGKIKSINPIADTETKKFPVKIAIDNKTKELKDGMYTKVVIPTEKRDGIVVPQQAVFIRDLLSYVYKIENGKVKRVQVTTGATVKPNIEVISEELKPGDLVVSDGIFGLADGDEVTINNETK